MQTELFLMRYVQSFQNAVEFESLVKIELYFILCMYNRHTDEYRRRRIFFGSSSGILCVFQFGSRNIALVQDTTDVVHVPQLWAARQPLSIY